ncbi:MAG: spore maturation protein [Erysipelotrichaceae bacterium]|nr:spore maturation protein [Erysipelotrichaceae bacterium]NBJ63691.1 spore maturation protein [bacterium c-19]
MIDSTLILPALVLLIFIIALCKRVPAYSVFLTGVKDGMGLFLDIYPALLAMMCAISLLRESGLMDIISGLFQYISTAIPSQIWPMVLFRPISGSASLAVLIDIFKTCGVDSLAGMMASIIQGSTDTTVYVITLYFSSVGIKKIGNSLSIGLIADIAGIGMAIFLTLLIFA